MALNLWKLAGWQSSYNPLPNGWVDGMFAPIGDFVWIFKAKSNKNGSIRFQAYGSNPFSQTVALTSEFKTIEHPFTLTKPTRLQFNDYNATNDIEIKDIQLVQKPLPKLTINGISGDVVDWVQGTRYGDNTVTTSTTVIGSLITSIPRSSDITFSVASGYQFFIRLMNDSQQTYVGSTWVSSQTINTGVANKIIVAVRKADNGIISPSDIANVKPMLNLGTTPAPYSKKTGERMVLPVAKSDGTFQLNKKPACPIAQAKQGLAFDNAYVDCGIGVYPYLDGKTEMTIDFIFNPKIWNNSWYWFVACNNDSQASHGFHVAVDVTSKKFFFYIKNQYVSFSSDLISVNQDNRITAVFKDGNRLELYLNGVRQGLTILQSPISILMPTSKLALGINKTFYYVSPLLKTDYTYVNIYNKALTMVEIDSKVILPILGYDFTQPQNIVGDKVIPNARNRIPSFEDARWSLHSNFKVLGKDVGRLESTTTGDKISSIFVPCLPNTSYQAIFEGNGYLYMAPTNEDKARFPAKVLNKQGGRYTFTTESGARYIEVVCYNANFIGTFDFIKPQLYLLDGKEGTLVGNPTRLNKASKRSLYAKR